MKNAIGYVRVSTEKQSEDDKYGIEVQQEAISAYAAEHGYQIVAWKVDTVSGAKDDRPALNEVLYGEDTTNPPYEAVIVFKNDRLARDTKLYFYYLYVLEKKNITLLSTKEEFAEGNEFTNIYRALLQFVAEQERKNIALRTTKGRVAKARYGGYSGGRAPYGYKAVDGRLVVKEDERALVQFIFREHYAGVNMLTIVGHLMENGFKTRKDTYMQVSTVKSILENEPLYRGMYKYGKDMDWVQGVHEPILTPEFLKEIGAE